ncbi:MAG: hypothetical protein HFE98_03895 [Ruminiclostridium sp.]|nr:hypothetical protein [Ruminiclostridium sp.]
MQREKIKLTGLLTLICLLMSLTECNVYAANGWEIDLSGSSTTTTQTNASVQLTMSGKSIQGTLDATNASSNPDEAGKVLTETATITVGNTDGYTVAVSGNASLTGRNNSARTIPSVSGNKTLGSMRNEWGYYGVLGDTEATWNPSTSFKAMTTGQQTVGTGGATTSNVTKKVTLFYGARVDGSIAEDFYGNTVTLSVVAQPRMVTTTVTKFGGITQMQQMTSTICSNAAINDTALLTDTRDNKKYWVTKLLDGNCWMSQNLDLNITTSNITTATSDVTSNWTSSSTYPPRATTTSITTGSTTQTETYSWDLGEYVLNTPTATTACSANNTGLSACSAQGFVNVSGWTASTDPNFYRATSYKGTDGASCTKTANTAVNASASGTCRVYDGHYLVGNYYQWNAATAGTGGTITNSNASGSVCPKGWKLPSSGNNTTKGTFGYMLPQYGVQGNLSGTSSVNGNTYNIALSPLFFVRGGYITPGFTDKFRYAGQSGGYWSSRAYSNTENAYYLLFSNSYVYPSNVNSRYFGFSLRCLVQTS